METVNVISDRYAPEAYETTVQQFLIDVEELGWETPELTKRGNYYVDQTGERVLEVAEEEA